MNLSDTRLNVWEERDRLHIELADNRTDKTLAEWWDDDARQMFEDGFFKRGRALHQSVFEYAEEMGMLAKRKRNPVKTPAQIIREHYQLNRPVTDAEVAAEIKNLKRRRDKALGWDDGAARLAARLGIDPKPFKQAFAGPMKNPIKGPGKFEGETYAVRYAYDNADDDLGDVQYFGWYGKFSGKIKGRGPFHIIVSEDNQGFVRGEFFDTEAQMEKQWNRIEREYNEFEDAAQ